MFRIAVVNSHPIQYFAPLYAYLNRDQEIEVTALYCSNFSLRGARDPGFMRTVKWDVDLLRGYKSVFLGEKAAQRIPGGFWSLVCPEVWTEIRANRYDVIFLNGYNYAAYVLAFLAAKSKGMPVFVRSETHSRLTRPTWKRFLRDHVLSLAYRSIDGFLAIGSANRSYYRSLGVPEAKIFDVPYTVDNGRFIRAARLTRESLATVRRKWGLSEKKPVVLYASKFLPRKHPEMLVRAAAALRDKGISFTLFLVGAGEMEQELREMVVCFGLQDVVFGGFVNQAELPKVYAASDVFVLPSENEPWGLIVNEAMCAGLPIIVSEEVGCVPDLVKDGINGYHVAAGDLRSLTWALEEVLGDEDRRIRMGEESLAIIQSWSYEECRQGVVRALNSVVR